MKKTLSDWARFDEKFVVNPKTGCWDWTAAKFGSGYGNFWYDGKSRCAHRFSYEMHVGKIQDGLVIDHLCRNTLCVNPDHMEVVTNKENILRGAGPTAINARKTHCDCGEPLQSYHGFYRHCPACAPKHKREYMRKAHNNA